MHTMNVLKKKRNDNEEQSITEPKEEYAVGDIVWAKIAGCPYWPSIVCYDPTTNLYIKDTGEKKNFSLHVRFCSYFGQRSWAKFIEKYTTRDMLLKKYPDCLISIKKNKKEMFSWEAAIKEADKLLKMERKKRILHFCSSYRLDYFKEFVDKDSSEARAQSSNHSASGPSNSAKKSISVLKDVDNKSNINNHNEASNAQRGRAAEASNALRGRAGEDSNALRGRAGEDSNILRSSTGARLYTLEQQKQLVIDTYGYAAYNPRLRPKKVEPLEINLTSVNKHSISLTDDFKRRINLLEEDLSTNPSTSPNTD